MKRSKRKPYWEMNAAELARATAKYDEEFSGDYFSEPSPEALKRIERAQSKPGRPREGHGVRVISVSVEKELLSRSDKLARKMGITRARLISRGLKAVLAAEGQM